MKEKSFFLSVALFVFFASSIVASAAQIKLASGRVVEVSEDTKYVTTILENRRKKAVGGMVKTESIVTQKAIPVLAVAQPMPVQTLSEPVAQIESPQVTSENSKIENPETILVAQPMPVQTLSEPVAQIESPEIVAKQTIVTTPTPTVKTGKSQWGANEFSLWGGIWKNVDADSEGKWLQGEYYHKFSLRDRPENLGLGVILKLDDGSNEQGADWGYKGVGPAMSYWTAPTTKDEFQLKLRLPYRWNENETGDDGFMPGIYMEYDRIVSRNDTLIFSAEGWYFENDSYVGLGGGIEHRVNRTLKLKGGVGASWNFLEDSTPFSWGPNVGLKFWDTLTIGASIGFSEGDTIYGGIAGLDFE